MAPIEKQARQATRKVMATSTAKGVNVSKAWTGFIDDAVVGDGGDRTAVPCGDQIIFVWAQVRALNANPAMVAADNREEVGQGQLCGEIQGYAAAAERAWKKLTHFAFLASISAAIARGVWYGLA